MIIYANFDAIFFFFFFFDDMQTTYNVHVHGVMATTIFLHIFKVHCTQGSTLTFFLGGPFGPLKSLIIHF